MESRCPGAAQRLAKVGLFLEWKNNPERIPNTFFPRENWIRLTLFFRRSSSYSRGAHRWQGFRLRCWKRQFCFFCWYFTSTCHRITIHFLREHTHHHHQIVDRSSFRRKLLHDFVDFSLICFPSFFSSSHRSSTRCVVVVSMRTFGRWDYGQTFSCGFLG
jgi:hypothetical protein